MSLSVTELARASHLFFAKMNESETAAGLPVTPHYRYAERVGDQLFVAGQVPQAADGSIVAPGEPHAQAFQCLANLSKVLAVHGYATLDIRRLVVYVIGEQADFTAAWGAVTEHFGGKVPPATLLGVARLGYPEQLVEIDATVVKGKD